MVYKLQITFKRTRSNAHAHLRRVGWLKRESPTPDPAAPALTPVDPLRERAVPSNPYSAAAGSGSRWSEACEGSIFIIWTAVSSRRWARLAAELQSGLRFGSAENTQQPNSPEDLSSHRTEIDKALAEQEERAAGRGGAGRGGAEVWLRRTVEQACQQRVKSTRPATVRVKGRRAAP